MTTYTVSKDGLVMGKTLEEILSEIESDKKVVDQRRINRLQSTQAHAEKVWAIKDQEARDQK